MVLENLVRRAKLSREFGTSDSSLDLVFTHGQRSYRAQLETEGTLFQGRGRPADAGDQRLEPVGAAFQES